MAGYLDAVAFHPYPDFGGGHLPSYAQDPCHGTKNWYRYWSGFGFGPDDPQCGGLAALRDVMVRNGDADKKIWATEFGFPSDGWREPQTMEHVRDALEEGVRMWRSLFRGAAMRSANGQFWRWMQADGNLVLYDARDGKQTAIWVQGGRFRPERRQHASTRIRRIHGRQIKTIFLGIHVGNFP
jgi:hypothetical protein